MKLQRIISSYRAKIKLLLSNGLYDIAESVVDATPIDTGAARCSWTASADGHGENVVFDRNISFAQSRANVIAHKAKLKTACDSVAFGERFFLVNNLPYIKQLEYGHSQQAPHGIYAKSRISKKSRGITSKGLAVHMVAKNIPKWKRVIYNVVGRLL